MPHDHCWRIRCHKWSLESTRIDPCLACGQRQACTSAAPGKIRQSPGITWMSWLKGARFSTFQPCWNGRLRCSGQTTWVCALLLYCVASYSPYYPTPHPFTDSILPTSSPHCAQIHPRCRPIMSNDDASEGSTRVSRDTWADWMSDRLSSKPGGTALAVASAASMAAAVAYASDDPSTQSKWLIRCSIANLVVPTIVSGLVKAGSKAIFGSNRPQSTASTAKSEREWMSMNAEEAILSLGSCMLEWGVGGPRVGTWAIY